MKKISKELEFIKGFSSISVNSICKDFNINRSNLINNKTQQEKIEVVYDILIIELFSLIEKYLIEQSKESLEKYRGEEDVKADIL